jgi:ribosomal protein S18 acetylase RimI-like enzyme
MKIQPAETGDLHTIVKLFQNAVENMIKNNIFQWDALYPNGDIVMDDIRKNQMYKIIFDNHIISVFVLNKEYDGEYANGLWEYKGDNFMVLHRLCVNTEYQNKGFGTRTMLCIEEYLKTTGIESIRLDTFSKNQAALKLYDKLGYKKTGEVNWRKGLFYLLEKQW